MFTTFPRIATNFRPDFHAGLILQPIFSFSRKYQFSKQVVKYQRKIVLMISQSTATNPGPDFNVWFAYFKMKKYFLRKVGDIFVGLHPDGHGNQLLRQILIKIDLSDHRSHLTPFGRRKHPLCRCKCR